MALELNSAIGGTITLAVELALLRHAVVTFRAPAKRTEFDDEVDASTERLIATNVLPELAVTTEAILRERREESIDEEGGVTPAEPIADTISRGTVSKEVESLLRTMDQAKVDERRADRWIVFNWWQFGFAVAASIFFPYMALQVLGVDVGLSGTPVIAVDTIGVVVLLLLVVTFFLTEGIRNRIATSSRRTRPLTIESK